jgi:hypothetical protein
MSLRLSKKSSVTLRAVAGGAGAVMLATIGVAVPASASVRSSGASAAVAGQAIGHRDVAETVGTLKITSAFCDGGDFSGFCQVEWSGGTAPYTVTWSLPGSDFFGTVGGFDSATRTATISGSCVAGGEIEAIATITDADGHTIQGGGGAECDS